MVCCLPLPVCYRVPNPCTALESITLDQTPQLSFILEQNTSGFGITGRNDAGNAYVPRVPGDGLSGLSNGLLGGDLGLRVDCGFGIHDFPGTVIARGTIGTHDRLMVGIGYWNGWGSVHNDGDGLTFDSCEVYNGATLLHTQSGMLAVNSGAFHETQFASPVANADIIRMIAGGKRFNGSQSANAQEVAPVWAWQSTLRWACQTTISARIRPVNPNSGPLSVTNAGNHWNAVRGGTVVASPGGGLTQTNGPHEISFNVPAGVTGTIITNQPGNFSNLTITSASPTTILSGNTTQTFDVSWDYGDEEFVRLGILTDGVLIDATTGAEVENALIVDCSTQRESCPPVSWFRSFPPHGGVWQFSSNAGATWGPAPNSVSHGSTGAGTFRWRQTFTIPPGVAGQWRIGINGDKADAPANGGTFWMDGVQIDSNTGPAYEQHFSPWITVAPGTHTFEWREGITGVGATVPTFFADYGQVTCT